MKVSYYHCQERKPYVQERKSKVFEKLGGLWERGRTSEPCHTGSEGVMESRHSRRNNYAGVGVWNRTSGTWWRSGYFPSFAQLSTGKQWVKLSPDALTITVMVTEGQTGMCGLIWNHRKQRYVPNRSRSLAHEDDMGQNYPGMGDGRSMSSNQKRILW